MKGEGEVDHQTGSEGDDSESDQRHQTCMGPVAADGDLSPQTV